MNPISRVRTWDRSDEREAAAPDSAPNPEGQVRERVRHNAEIQGGPEAVNETSRGGEASSNTTAAASAPSATAAGGGGGGGGGGDDQEQNQDIVRLSSHIERMQRICRQSLSNLGTVSMATQRRHVVRLQAIRRMLEDLQRQIRSLRDASYRELDRRARMEVGRRERERQLAQSQSDRVAAHAQQTGAGNATRTTTTLTDSRSSSAATAAAARLRQRSTAVLSRIAAGGSHAHSRHRVPLSRRGGGGSGGRISPGSGAGRNSPSGSRGARSAAVPRYEIINEVSIGTLSYQMEIK